MNPENKILLVTGSAGFIGFHLCRRLLADGHQVIGIDNLNPYYDVNLKLARLAILREQSRFTFYKTDLADLHDMEELFKRHGDQPFDTVINLAAQPGVRYSLKNPHSYIHSNIVGFTNILEYCRYNAVKHLVFASSSSVYGINAKIPFSVSDNVDHPVSLYAASKKANELMAHTYAHLYGLPCTGLRFFTVYGPRQRPEMAIYKFTKQIYSGEKITIFGDGSSSRDYTYIDDIVTGIKKCIDRVKGYEIINLGNSSPVKLIDLIKLIENVSGKKADIAMEDMKPGDVFTTFADINKANEILGFKPQTPIKEGLEKFVAWYEKNLIDGNTYE